MRESRAEQTDEAEETQHILDNIMGQREDPIHKNKHVYDSFEKCPKAALGLLYSNTGLGQHPSLRKLYLKQLQYSISLSRMEADIEAGKLRCRRDELDSMKISELKKLLREFSVSFEGCVDKRELVEKLIGTGQVEITELPVIEFNKSKFEGKSIKANSRAKVWAS